MNPGAIEKILQDAGVPLTPEQITQMKTLRGTPDAQLQSILTEQQKQALETARQEQMQARQDARQQRQENIDARRDSLKVSMEQARAREITQIAGILEQAGAPLTPDQLAQLNAPATPPRIQAILTDQQKQALTDARKQQQQAARQERLTQFRERMETTLDNTIDRMSQILDTAGVPLISDQLAQLQALDPVRDLIPGIQNILTAEQKQAIRKSGAPLLERLRNVQNSLKNPRNPDPTAGALQPGENGTGKATDVAEQPLAFTLRQNYPNPFNPATTIEYSIATQEHVLVEVFGQNGQKVATLVDSDQNAGIHSVVWDASQNSNGTYLCRITAGEFQTSMKMLFVK